MSRELDVRVAEALGLDVCRCQRGTAVSQGNRLICASWSCGKAIGRAYSSFIDAAWELVEQASGEFYLSLAADRWWAMFGDDLDDGRFADTAPEAICLAFLAAKEADDAAP